MKKTPTTTRTLNPLPFNDLEPHRFEDLVRQLIYDFREWRLLEPTGRLGADDGYDARGFEVAGATNQQPTKDSEDELEEELISSSLDRLWQIQCKREKTIAPAKINKYVDEMIPRGADIPHGVIFAAPCDFSKKTRDAFREKMREKGVQEFYLWGKADLEDMLFQPKNDNLLYGYFGISLIIRRRTVATQIRSLLATKRKVVKHLGAVDRESFMEVLVRDANDTNYPYSGAIPDFKEHPRWKTYYFMGHTHEGIRLMTRRYPAYRKIDFNGMKLLEWDYTEEVNLAWGHEDFWNKPKDYDDSFRRAHDFLDTIERDNQAFFEIEAVIPYERIVEIDPLGDTIAKCPHIFVETKNNTFFDYGITYLAPRGERWQHKQEVTKEDEKTRVKIFPKKLPPPKKIEPLPPMGSKKKEETVNPEFEDLNDKKK
ncbi:MAG: hypothetical protein WCT44_03540 [Candidatus Paceibacterota bacterium]